jgi:hypothetical protein
MRNKRFVGVGLAVGILFAGLFAWALWERVRAAGTLAPGTVIEVERPTGEMIHAAGGSGEGQMRYERVKMKVVKVRGESAAVPSNPAPWRVTVGGTTYVCSPLE